MASLSVESGQTLQVGAENHNVCRLAIVNDMQRQVVVVAKCKANIESDLWLA